MACYEAFYRLPARRPGKNDPDAHAALADICLQGKYPGRNHKLALHHAEAAAAGRHPVAFADTGRHLPLRFGHGPRYGKKAPAALLRRAAPK